MVEVCCSCLRYQSLADRSYVIPRYESPSLAVYSACMCKKTCMTSLLAGDADVLSQVLRSILGEWCLPCVKTLSHSHEALGAYAGRRSY